MSKQKLLEKVNELKKLRQEMCGYGQVGMVQSINHDIFCIAKKLKVDYYSIA